MKSILKASLAVALLSLSATTVKAEDVIESAMKKFHKGETSLVKKIGGGEASPAEIASLLSAYEEMAKATPPQGTKDSWTTKTGAVIAGLKTIQSGGTAGAFKQSVACKACHEVHKGKK